MELTAFNNMPDELIRLIMEYARPTYNYLPELRLKISHNHLMCFREWKKITNYKITKDLRLASDTGNETYYNECLNKLFFLGIDDW